MREIPPTAIPITEHMPPRNREVLGYVSDADVAIHHFPSVIRNSGSDAEPQWWAGLPGHWIALSDERWVVTHWELLPVDRS